uniref:WAP, Kazal, immunoglobulin, Kunitz and NTR domain-containing protein 1-like n=1 Tax=Pristiophorus japonicus TaxID=55135 RepID=UPI00398EB967
MLVLLHGCVKCCRSGLGLRFVKKPRTLLIVLSLLGLTEGASLPRGKLSYPGACPNQLNPNLWVDAQSTCERECNADEDCQNFEKCCTNVCGLRSCVAARFADGSLASLGMDLPKEATCERTVCTQQGSECDIWDGQPVCKCKDRCEKEPNFTCASDGLTYYNKCYMDAEACIRGISLSVVTCRYHISWPNTSPQPLETTTDPTSTTSLEGSVAPALYTNPFHQSVYLGGTVSFHCDVSGRPRPDITWEKQSDERENIIMRPDQMYANVVVTNIGQLVIYSARQEDAGIYTCTARNAAGLLRADFPLSVIRREHSGPDTAAKSPPLPPGECSREPDKRQCGRRHVRWYHDPQRAACSTFTFGGCDGSRNRFETYEECRRACINETVNICSFPAVQGPCRLWQARWAYNSLMRQCHAFVFGGCQGNRNNFESKEVCEGTCPFPKNQRCKACRPRHKIVPSFCRSDYAIVGRVTEIVEEPDSGVARFTLDEVLKDEKMGLKFFDFKHLEVTLINMDWNCPCPNMTLADGPLLIMGEVHDGMAVLDADSYVRTVSDKRVKKMYEIIEKKTCEFLHRFQD